MNISKVSEQFSISPDTLRYYEKIGLIPPVNRGKSGIRDYNETDLGWVKFIKCMRTAGLSIESLIEYVTLFRQGDKTNQARKDILIEQRAQLQSKMEAMGKSLSILDHKIKIYESKVLEKKLRPNGARLDESYKLDNF